MGRVCAQVSRLCRAARAKSCTPNQPKKPIRTPRATESWLIFGSKQRAFGGCFAEVHAQGSKPVRQTPGYWHKLTLAGFGVVLYTFGAWILPKSAF